MASGGELEMLSLRLAQEGADPVVHRCSDQMCMLSSANRLFFAMQLDGFSKMPGSLHVHSPTWALQMDNTVLRAFTKLCF